VGWRVRIYMDQEHLHETVIANDALILRGHAYCCTTILEYGWLESDLFAQQRFTQKKDPTSTAKKLQCLLIGVDRK
jgi:hypothetical protein